MGEFEEWLNTEITRLTDAQQEETRQSDWHRLQGAIDQTNYILKKLQGN